MQGHGVAIIPSIASDNMLNVKEEIRFIDRNYGHIHIDIEDGNYIPNITFGEKLLKRICQNSSSHKSVHLMVNKPEAFFKSNKGMQARYSVPLYRCNKIPQGTNKALPG